MKWKPGDMSLAKKGITIMALFLIPLVGAIVIEGAYPSSIRALNNRLALARETLLKQQELLTLMLDAETGVRGYLLTKNQSFLDPYRTARSALPSLLRDVQARERSFDHNDSFYNDAILAHREMSVLLRLVDFGPSRRAL